MPSLVGGVGAGANDIVASDERTRVVVIRVCWMLVKELEHFWRAFMTLLLDTACNTNTYEGLQSDAR